MEEELSGNPAIDWDGKEYGLDLLGTLSAPQTPDAREIGREQEGPAL